jgi:hypothetical protein
MKPVLNPAEIDVNKILISKLKTKKYESGQETKQCRVTYDHKTGIDDLAVRVPRATVPFGLTLAKEKEGETPLKYKKYSLEFNISGSPEMDEFGKFVDDFDNKNIDFILKESLTWWKKSYSRDTIADACYGSMKKRTPEEKGDYPDRFKMKLPFNKGLPDFKVYDKFNKPIKWVKKGKNGEPPELDWSWIQPKMQIDAIMECEALWEVNKKVYCTFKAVQIRVHPRSSIPDCDFPGDVPGDGDAPENNEDEEETKQSVPKLAAPSDDEEEVVSKSKVEDDEDEDDEDDSKLKVEDDDDEDEE